MEVKNMLLFMQSFAGFSVIGHRSIKYGGKIEDTLMFRSWMY